MHTVDVYLYTWLASVAKQSCLINNENKLFAVCRVIFSIFVSLKRQLQGIVNILVEAQFLDPF